MVAASDGEGIKNPPDHEWEIATKIIIKAGHADYADAYSVCRNAYR
jgi:hypothetical protein